MFIGYRGIDIFMCTVTQVQPSSLLYSDIIIAT